MRAGLMLLVAAVPVLAQTTPPAGPLTFPGPNIVNAPKKPPAKPGAATAAGPPAAHPTAAGPSYKDLKFGPLRPVQVPKVDTVTLPNGLRLYLLEDHELPVVNGTAMIHAGTLLDPPDKVGLAALASRAMRTGGAGSANPDQVDERLEDIAATVEMVAATNSITATFSGLKESAPQVLATFKDVLTAPQFNEEKIDAARTQLRNAIAHRNDDGGRVAQRELSDILYGRDTPYGRETEYATLGNILRSDLQAFHARYFFPKNTLLAIRGDFDSAQMKAQVEKIFADWTVEQPPPEFPKEQPASNPELAGVYVATKRDVAKAYFAAGQQGGVLTDKDYAALAIMADILGGGSSNRLLQRLHARTASNFTISAKWEPGYLVPGLFQVSGAIAPVYAVDTVRAIQEEVGRIRTSEVTEEELNAAKDGAINSLVFAFDTKAKTLSRVLTYEFYGYPADFIDRFQKALEGVSRADVLRVAKERLKPETFATVLVGDPGDFSQPVESLKQTVRKIDLTIPEPKLKAAKFDAASLEKGKIILARIQQAVGGLEKLAALKDTTLVTEYIVDQGGKVTPVKHTERWIAPMHYREDNELGGGTITAYFDGEFGWITVPGGSVPLSGATLKQVEGNAARQYQILLTSGTITRATVNAVDDQTIEITSPFGTSARVVMDLSTGLPLKIRYDGTSRSGPPPLTEEAWSDFREVGGVKVPFKVTIIQGGRKYADVSVTDFRINSGLKVTDLDRRP